MKRKFIFLSVFALWVLLTGFFSSQAVAGVFEVHGSSISHNGEEVKLYGVNWFGSETENHVPHGLWSRGYEEMIQQIKQLGFNAVRFPFCPDTLRNVAATSIDYSKNPELQGLGSLEIMDVIIQEFDNNGIYILLDHHRPDCNAISELWYIDSYSEQAWITDLTFVADRYRNVEHFLGIDMKNEPHGAATWGTGNASTDWDGAAARAAASILNSNPDILVFVEGIGENPTCSSSTNHWWGGNLEPQACFPLDIADNKLVFSPHVYGPDVFVQPYFGDSNFPANMPAIWDQHFGFLADQGRVLAPGEFGGKYGHGGEPEDVSWQNALVDYFIDKQVCNFFFWSWNPNSGDTGGILQDDWTNIWQDKYDNLKRLMDACGMETTPACSDGRDNDGDDLIDMNDPGCENTQDDDEFNATPQKTQCNDGVDNDSDGFVDMNDPGCENAQDDDEFNATDSGQADVEVVSQSDWGTGYCADGLVTNNTSQPLTWVVTVEVDGTIKDFWNGLYTLRDGLVEVRGAVWNDVVAPGQSTSFGFCANRDDPLPPQPACSDGIDNDGDGFIDLDDPGCDNAQDDDEYNTPPQEPQCNDGNDNDGDGFVDLDDPGCDNAQDNDEYNAPPPQPQCNDGSDNDGDGFVDLEDPGCDNAQDDDEYNASVPGELETEIVTQSDWGTGYCADILIRNNGSAEVDWQVTVDIEGRTTTVWNAIVEERDGTLTLEGLSWNNTIPAGGTLGSIGFCAQR